MVLVWVFEGLHPHLPGGFWGLGFSLDICHCLAGRKVVIAIDCDVGYDCHKNLCLLCCIHSPLDQKTLEDLEAAKLVLVAFLVYNHLSAVSHIHPFDMSGRNVRHNDHVLFLVLGDHHDQRCLLWHSLESVFFVKVQQLPARCGCSFAALKFLNLKWCQPLSRFLDVSTYASSCL